jgi:hypothetical protein
MSVEDRIEALDEVLGTIEEAVWVLGFTTLKRPGIARPTTSHRRHMTDGAVAALAESGDGRARADRLAAVVAPLADLEARLRNPGRTCAECQRAMGVKRAGAIYCSSTCRQKACRRRNRRGSG